MIGSVGILVGCVHFVECWGFVRQQNILLFVAWVDVEILQKEDIGVVLANFQMTV